MNDVNTDHLMEYENWRCQQSKCVSHSETVIMYTFDIAEPVPEYERKKKRKTHKTMAI